MANRNLVFFDINYSEKEIELFKLCFQSLISATEKQNFDVLIITNYDFKKKIKKIVDTINFTNIKYLLVPRDIYFDKASMKVLDLFSFPDIHMYKKVLHLRCDMIIQRDLSVIFDLPIKNNRIYSYTEDTYNHNSPYYGLQNYTEEDLLFFKTNYIKTFSSAVFLLKPDMFMRKHFQNIRKLADVYSGTSTGKTYFDQCYFNFYFNSYKLSNTKLLQNYIETRNIKTNIEGKPTVNDTSIDIQTVIVNFCGLSYYEEKQLRMKRYLKLIEQMHTCMIKARKTQKVYLNQ